MPGRTPAAALEQFLGPIQAALACAGAAKITRYPRNPMPGDECHWEINAGDGMDVGAWRLDASMYFELLENKQSKSSRERYEVSTRAYLYSIAREGSERVAMHWHPAGVSHYVEPHLHLRDLTGDADERSGHLPTGRHTFEEAVSWFIALNGAPARDDWQEVLEASRMVHARHRTWHASRSKSV